MVEEVRRQLRAIPDLLEGHANPDYGTCVNILTDAPLTERFILVSL
jgi:inorganic pyrophosphatase